MSLSRYSHNFSKAVTLVKNKPNLAEKISKESYYTVEQLCLRVSNPTTFTPRRP